MKTKNKVIVLVEIAIVLCSVFLVALPAIATEQNQEMQTVSASTSEVTTALEDEFTLEIYGNANEDDTIDMRDTTYIKLAIFGKKPKTDLADANNDGKISMLDVGQTNLIILDKEKEITVVDTMGRAVTVVQPLERVVVMGVYAAEAIAALGAQDKVIGGTENHVLLPSFSISGIYQGIPSIGNSKSPCVERIIELKPELVIALWVTPGRPSYELAEKLKDCDIPVASIHCCPDVSTIDTVYDDVRILGVLFAKEQRAQELVDFLQECVNLINERTQSLEPSQRTRVYTEANPYYLSGNARVVVATARGGDILTSLPGSAKVDPEWVAEKNPEVIVVTPYLSTFLGHEVTDAEEARKLRQEIVNRPELAETEAVKKERVYVTDFEIIFSPRAVIGALYMAKWFYPEKFQDIDPESFHKEYFEKFLGIEYTGIWVYPESS